MIRAARRPLHVRFVRASFLTARVLACVAAVACGELQTNPGKDGGSDAGPTACELAANDRPTCDPSSCPDAGLTCSAGECVYRCSPADDVCLTHEFCTGTTCEPRARPDCDERPCNCDQACVDGTCVGVRELTCADDSACAARERCDPALGRCVDLVECDADGRCRLGTRGAACNRRPPNEAIDTAKDVGTCLVGRCRDDLDCPATMDCVEKDGVTGLGSCAPAT